MLAELSRAAHEDRRLFLNERKADFPGERFRKFLTVQLIELWLGIEKIHLAGGPFHEYEDARFGFGCEMRRTRGESIVRRIGRKESFIAQNRGEREHAEAARCSSEKVAAGEVVEIPARDCPGGNSPAIRLLSARVST